MMNINTEQSVGELLREWRKRRRMSQLDLACEAEISTKHLSFLETGRAQPSRDMLLHLADRLDIPLRERNVLLVVGGYAPSFPERPLDDAALQAVRKAVEMVLAGHEPFPALAIDRHWTLVAANRAVPPLLARVDPALLHPPVNVLRLSLHPAGLAPHIANYWDWRAHLLARLRRQIGLSADPALMALLKELSAFSPPDAAGSRTPTAHRAYSDVVVPLQLRADNGVLTFVSTTTIFGTPVDITLSELAIESFYPANSETAEIMRRLATRT